MSSEHDKKLGYWRLYVFSTDHKVIGIQYAITSLCFLFFGFCLMMLMRWQLAYPLQEIPVLGGLLGGLGKWGETFMPGGVMTPDFTAVADIGTVIVKTIAFALCGVALMLLTGCLQWRDAADALNIPVIMLIVASLSLGSALMDTGGAEFIAQLFVFMTQPLPTPMILSGLILLMTILTNVVSNNAAAVIGTPVAISIAQQLQAPVEPFILAVIFGANVSFATPIGYHTNLLIMSAGGYKFSDFMRVGIPLTLVMWLAFTVIMPILYSL